MPSKISPKDLSASTDATPDDSDTAITARITTPRIRPAPEVSITVPEGFDGRIDKLIAEQFPGVGRKRLAELFESGAVRSNGKRCKKGDFVTPGDQVDLAIKPVSRSEETPIADPDAAAQLTVVLKHQDFVIVSKPAQMPTQPLRAGERGTAANGIAHLFPECSALGDDVRDGGLVNRLDIGTSGLLIAARTESGYRTLRDAFATGGVHKEYLAVVSGRLGANECAAPLTQRGDHVVADFAEGLSAYTEFTVEKTSGDVSLVRCIARSGRMHQVRAHLALTGAPIIGDTRYGAPATPLLPGFFLHAEVMTLQFGSERISATAPMPKSHTAVLKQLGLA
jgi:23S rRNA pseudouridine1911/1915/1917 synthase